MPPGCTMAASSPTARSSTRTVIPPSLSPGGRGKRIHEAERIGLRSFDRGFIDDAVTALERRNTMTLSVTEGSVYLELNGATSSSAVHDHSIV